MSARIQETARATAVDFDFDRKFVPDGLSKIGTLAFLQPAEARLLSQVQGRTYANMLALVERFIGAKTLEQSEGHRLGERAAAQMPPGYCFVPAPHDVASAVLGKSTWAVLALRLDIEISALAHYRSSIDPDPNLCPLWKDVFLYHWKAASQHAIVDELQCRLEHARLSQAERETGVDDLIALVGAVDGLVQMQAEADAGYCLRHAGGQWSAAEEAAVRDGLLSAYRWQYIASGMQEPRFAEVIRALLTPAQRQRIGRALAPIMTHADR